MRFFWNRNRTLNVATQVPVDPQYDAFKKRLYSAYCQHFKAWTPPLSDLLKQTDLLDILSYISDIDHDFIRNLKPRETIRIAKKTQGYLPRTIEILRTHTGEFQLIIDTRSKIAKQQRNGQPQKRRQPKNAGSYKKYKRSWRVDCIPPVPKANLITYLSPDVILRHWECEDIEREILLSQQSGALSEHICVYEMGARYASQDKHHNLNYKIGCYAEDLTMSLYELISSKTLSDQQLDRLRLDILEGVATLHKQGIIHQDLKVNNIMVYQDNHFQWRAKIIDLGLAKAPISPTKDAVAGGFFQSPEIAYFYSDKHDYQQWRYYHKKHNSALGNQFTPKGLPVDYKAPHKANDMWALGILFYFMDKKCLPKQMADIQEPLIKRLLEVDRTQRINIDEAITLQYSMMRPKYPAPKPILNAFDMSDLRSQIEKVWCDAPHVASEQTHSATAAQIISCF